MNFQKNKVFLLFLFAFNTFSFAIAQNTQQFQIQWRISEGANAKGDMVKFENFDESFNDVEWGTIPIWNKQFQNNFNNADLKNVIYEVSPISYPKEITDKLNDQVIIFSRVVYDRKKPSLLTTIIPLRKNPLTGKIERLISFNLSFKNNSANKTNNIVARNYAANSVLKTGNWYKLSISSSGIYKIGYKELQKIGIEPNSINPKNIRIYGNGGGMVPEFNGTFRHDDLAENAIKVIGEEDGVFNDNDYILFYGFGPLTLNADTNLKVFSHVDNPYSLSTYYFITADLGLGKRISTRNSSSQTPNKFITSFNYFQLHELNNSTGVNATIKSGRERFGEEFNNVLTYDFQFTVPDVITTSPMKYRAEVIGRAQTPANSSFAIKVNNQLTNTLFCSGVEFSYDAAYGSIATTGHSIISNPSSNININITYTKPDLTATGYLNFIELNAYRKLKFIDAQMSFKSIESYGNGKICQFTIESNSPNETKIWDITDKINPIEQVNFVQAETNNFIIPTPDLKEFVVYKGNDFPSPGIVGRIENQDLHSLGFYDFIIISHPDFLSEAERLAAFRRDNNNLRVLVITEDKIFNEFGSGAKDASAIRDFIKMFYDRAGNNSVNMPKYLLMFGDGSYDNIGYVKVNSNYVTTFESRNSNTPFGSYVSDDFYGMLDDVEGDYDYNSSSVFGASAFDVAVGRLPVQNSLEARQMVDKIIHYSNVSTFDDWRNKYVLVADDQDDNLHVNDAEEHYRTIRALTKDYNIDKIYLDAYPQISTPAGSRYPDVNNAINQNMASGALVINYIGHGGEVGLGHEKILTIDDINSWKNFDNLPLLMTATCSFSRWDDPAVQSAGELCLLNSKGGAIAMFTTTRIVYAFDNKLLNSSFIRALFDSTNVGGTNTLGDIFRKSKNYNGIVNSINMRNFSLLGDPSLPFATPKYSIVTDSINSKDIHANNADTIKAQNTITIKGHIADKNGNKLNNYSGIVYPAVYDKKATLKTLGQDIGLHGSKVQNFELQKNVIYKGKVSVNNGEFSFSFVVPKDISYTTGLGRLSYYAKSGIVDANGSYDSIIVGGSSNTINTDHIGPELKIFINNESFAAGGISNETPKLIVKLKDSNGINTVGNGIGHDLTATLTKGTESETIDLNQYYESKLDSYQEGEINYPFNKLEAGNYTLKVKAWDVFNNSSEISTSFSVLESKDLQIDRVFNYPNPFTSNTDFQFEHNRPSDNLQVQVQVFTVSGKLIKTLNQAVNGSGSRVTGILWDGKDDFGDKIGRGVYVYRLKVRSSDGKSAEKYEKLVLLN